MSNGESFFRSKYAKARAFNNRSEEQVILFRYFSREIYATLVATACILLLILVTNQVIHYLKDAATGIISAFSLLQLFIVQAPLLLGFLLPLAFFISVLLVIGRLSNENEMTAAFASGLSRAQFLKLITIFAAGVAIIVMILMFWMEPYMNWYRKNVIAFAKSSNPIERMLPGHFQGFGGGWVLYTEDLTKDRQSLKHIFAAKVPKKAFSSKDKWTIITADSAEQITKDDRDYLELRSGNRYSLAPKTQDFLIDSYEKFGIKLTQSPPKLKNDAEFKSMTELWNSSPKDHQAAAEFQWRISLPLSTILLAFVAVGLCPTRPVKSRFSLLLPGIFIYIGYANLMFISRAWIQQGEISHALGLWWVHGSLAVIAFLLLARSFGWFERKRAKQ